MGSIWIVFIGLNFSLKTKVVGSDCISTKFQLNENERLNGVIKVVGKDYISTQFQPNDKQDEISQIVGKDCISTQFKLETNLLDVPFDDSTLEDVEPTLYMENMNKQENSTKCVGNDCISTNSKPEINLLDMSFEELKPMVYKSTLPTNYAKDNGNGSYVGNDCMFAGFQQIYGIPMDNNCAPLLVTLFLYSYVADFIHFFRKTNRRQSDPLKKTTH